MELLSNHEGNRNAGNHKPHSHLSVTVCHTDVRTEFSNVAKNMAAPARPGCPFRFRFLSNFYASIMSDILSGIDSASKLSVGGFPARTETDRTYLYGYALLILCFGFFVFAAYFLVISKFMPMGHLCWTDETRHVLLHFASIDDSCGSGFCILNR